MSKTSVFFCIALFGLTFSGHASMKLSENAVYYLPGFTQTIQQVKFNDIDSDGNPEILASDGHRLSLISSSDGAVLFDLPLDYGYSEYSILFDDINLDLSPDIVIGYYYNPDRFQQDTVSRLDFFDGAGDFAVSDTVFFESDFDPVTCSPSPFGLTALQAADVTNDGFANLIFAYDRSGLMFIGSETIQVTSGKTLAYQNPPGQIEWEYSGPLSPLHVIPNLTVERVFATTRLDNFSALPGDTKITGKLEIISEDGTSVTSLSEPLAITCSGDSTQITSILECLCVGDIDLSSDGAEILTRYSWQQICFQAGEISFDSSSTSLRLYSFDPSEGLTMLWTLDEPPGKDFRYFDDRPGSFYSIDGGIVRKHSGTDGYTVHEGEPIYADTLIWCEKPQLAGGQLLAITGQTVTAHSLDIVTDIEEEPTALPNTYKLGQPYPNPFNPSCTIEFALPNRARVTVSVVNTTGQTVTTIFDGIKSGGVHKIRWDGSGGDGHRVASGVYFIRMETAEFRQSRKMLLLK